MKNGKQAEHFVCTECNADHVKADEDWCCSVCGSECLILPCSCPPAVMECKESGRCGTFVSSVCVPGFPCFENDRRFNGNYTLARTDERRKTLRDVRDMLFLEHRKELGMIVGGTETERAVTKIFTQFIKRMESME
jgi:hypothetical protein